MTKGQQPLYDVYGFDFVAVWFRIVTKAGFMLPPHLAGWPIIDRWTRLELARRAKDSVLQQIESEGYVFVMDSFPEEQFFSRRTLLKPHIEVQDLGVLDDGQQYVRIPKELSFKGRYVFMQTMKDGSILIRRVPTPFERELMTEDAQSIAGHNLHSLLIPKLEAKERVKNDKKQ